ncbi:channel-forming protein ArfA/OmpATb [Mycobacterium shigaense]|uniref:Peptidoglycan-binding protein ArfA n=1 Tax=Mycobacterium shigaense TaxID=722731 RepID=A0A1Z4EMT9_9MYCO|nr:BON domain-containing protein [Mycobacterium shigaense]PRI13058.1 hypothetical protein B2J96_23635 [Mycobacterium shigaense]BAX94275.1 peptidoglycan-binding protein ArfA [Mycobacterium shigaense]
MTLTGEVPDDSAKAILLKTLRGALPAGIDIIDQIKLHPAVDALDFSHAGSLFKDSASITDFDFAVGADTITLTGTAVSQDQKNTIERDVRHTWSHLNVIDGLAVGGPASPPAASGPGVG